MLIIFIMFVLSYIIFHILNYFESFELGWMKHPWLSVQLLLNSQDCLSIYQVDFISYFSNKKSHMVLKCSAVPILSAGKAFVSIHRAIYFFWMFYAFSQVLMFFKSRAFIFKNEILLVQLEPIEIFRKMDAVVNVQGRGDCIYEYVECLCVEN